MDYKYLPYTCNIEAGIIMLKNWKAGTEQLSLPKPFSNQGNLQSPLEKEALFNKCWVNL